MYGSRASRNQDNPTQAGADKMRTPDVLRAEERLAKSLGITASSTAEGEFKVDAKGKHEAVQVSNSYPGQAITVSVFATPRGGYHRVDSYDGSIALSQKQVKVGDGEYKNQIIDSIAKSAGKGGITKQVEALNVFLKQHAKSEVTTAQYVQFLKDGNVKSLGVEGLTTQAGKTTQVFEGRSMIAGNVCMNRIHGIAYPLFELESTTPGRTITQQPTGPVATMDYGAAVNVVGVTGAESALGLSPIALAAKLKQNRNNPPPQQNQPAPNTTPGVIDNGPIQPPT